MSSSSLLLRISRPIFRQAFARASKQLLKVSTIGIATYYLIANDSYCMNNGASDSSSAIGSDASGRGGGDAKNKKGGNDAVESAITKLAPYLNQIGFGTVAGFCSGYVMKKVGQIAAILVGVGFIGFQVVKYYSGEEKLVDMDKLKAEAEKRLDIDGDGKFNSNDVIILWRKWKNILTNNIPDATGFSAGFLLGLRF